VTSKKEKQMSDYHDNDASRKSFVLEVPATFTGKKLMWAQCCAYDRRLKTLDKLVAYALTKYLNENTAECFPGQETIADDLGVAVRHVRRSLARLAKTGWLRCKRIRAPTTGKVSNHYWPLSTHMAEQAEKMATAAAARKAKRSAQREAQQETNRTPESSGPPTKRTPESCSDRTPESSEHFHRNTFKDEHIHRHASAHADARPEFDWHTNEQFEEMYGSSADDMLARYRAKQRANK
jgi:hypothetical protein